MHAQNNFSEQFGGRSEDGESSSAMVSLARACWLAVSLIAQLSACSGQLSTSTVKCTGHKGDAVDCEPAITKVISRGGREGQRAYILGVDVHRIWLHNAL